MQKDRLRKNIMDQMKEAQQKLGFERETVRLYYPVSSLNALLGLSFENAGDLKAELKRQFSGADEKLGELSFAVHGGRIEISVPPEGAEYVHLHMPDAPFLMDMIQLFSDPHHCTLESVKAIFAKYSSHYVCEKMPEGMDFDYVLYFPDHIPDEYYYCIREEMGHTIYHRFMKEDYDCLFL